jgi:hypothetical protein
MCRDTRQPDGDLESHVSAGITFDQRFESERQCYRERLEELETRLEQRFKAESLAAQREAIAQRESERAADERAAAEQRAQEKGSAVKPLLFIVATLGAWWLILVLANITVTCVPGGEPCRGSWPLTPAMQMTWLQWTVILISVVAALWVARSLVYPTKDN